MKSPNQQSEWSRARGLLAELNKAARTSVSSQILLGKELTILQKRLGFSPGGDRKRSKQHNVVLIDAPTTWDGWCQAELSITSQTARRYIACFEYALGRAKAHKAKNPEAFRLLATPAAELTGEELEQLAAHVGSLVRYDGNDSQPLTQRQILEELGIVKVPKVLVGGDTSEHRKPTPDHAVETWAVIVFSQMARGFGQLERSVFNAKDSPDYRLLLDKLPLVSAEEGKPSLMSIKECVSGILNGGVAEILRDVEAAIESRMHGKPPKAARKKKSSTAKAR